MHCLDSIECLTPVGTQESGVEYVYIEDMSDRSLSVFGCLFDAINQLIALVAPDPQKLQWDSNAMATHLPTQSLCQQMPT